ncbi:MAG: ACT domain-containing protein, partial [Selenomonadaceae bacterium]
KERNIKITEVKNKEVKNFANLLTVCIKTAAKELKVEGTLFGEEGRIVAIDDYRVDVDPHARILICPHINRPGIIGSVGSVMGAAGINISSMQVSKTEATGTNIMVLTIDNDIPANILKEVINIDGIFGAKLVNFYAV